MISTKCSECMFASPIPDSFSNSCSKNIIDHISSIKKTIEKIIKEAEEAYNLALDSVVDEKELERLEKNYNDSLKLMRTFNQIKSKK